MTRRRAVTVWCWLLAAALLAGCAAEQEPDASEVATTPPAPGVTAPGSPASPASPAASDGQEVPEALDFTLPALDGGQVVGAELAGRAVALWFWTPW